MRRRTLFEQRDTREKRARSHHAPPRVTLDATRKVRIPLSRRKRAAASRLASAPVLKKTLVPVVQPVPSPRAARRGIAARVARRTRRGVHHCHRDSAGPPRRRHAGHRADGASATPSPSASAARGGGDGSETTAPRARRAGERFEPGARRPRKPMPQARQTRQRDRRAPREGPVEGAASTVQLLAYPGETSGRNRYAAAPAAPRTPTRVDAEKPGDASAGASQATSAELTSTLAVSASHEEEEERERVSRTSPNPIPIPIPKSHAPRVSPEPETHTTPPPPEGPAAGHAARVAARPRRRARPLQPRALARGRTPERERRGGVRRVVQEPDAQRAEDARRVVPREEVPRDGWSNRRGEGVT